MLEVAFIMLASALPGADANAIQLVEREHRLHRLLDQAVMLNRTQRRNQEEPTSDETEEDREMNIELAEMELEGGYLAKACILEPKRVKGIRSLKTYVQLLDLVGYSDDEIKDIVIARAGDKAEKVRQLLEFAGLHSMHHFICVDYLRARLREGMEPQDLRAYIDNIAPSEMENVVLAAKQR